MTPSDSASTPREWEPQGPPSRKLAILGSTGSIGRSTLDVVRASAGRLSVVALSAHSNTDLLCQQAREFRPQWIIPTDPEAAGKCDWSQLSNGCEVVCAADGMQRVVQDPAVDVVVAAIVGSAGLGGTWAAIEAGKTVALANKETLVMAGPLVMPLAASRKANILPIDSEHSAVFQALAAGRREDLRRIVLTASGGPFRRMSKEQMSQVTVEQALAHPTWQMGPKITVDSATMMNKALEIIEARWLFDLGPDQIEVMVHPQSVVHSLVEFNDGSVLAQMSPPDMKLPIQYALTWPERRPSPARKVDWTSAWQLEFEPPDEDRFPALSLGREVARVGGTAGAVLNAANEAAVARFLRGELKFLQIVPVCRAVIDHHSYDPSPTLSQLMTLDAWAREEVQRWKA
jgi:1-deoxy-D-xylulose-5-phosphate reductoisomerase